MNPRHFFLGASGPIANSPSFQSRIKGLDHSTFSIVEKDFCLFAQEPKTGIALTPLPEKQGAIFGKIFEKDRSTEVANLSSFIQTNYGKRTISFDRFWGKYVGAFFDKASRTFSLFRDPLGFSTLFYAATDQGVIFSSQLHLLYDLLEEKPQLNWNYFAEKIFDQNQCLSSAPFQGIHEVLPGMELSFDSNFEMRSRHFWDIENLSCDFITNKDAFEEELLEVLKTSVKAWGSGHDAIALELSGGTDSSGVLILLKHLFPDKQIFPIHYYDSNAMNSSEMHYAESVASSCGYSLEKVDCVGDSWLDQNPLEWRSNRTRGCLHTLKRMEEIEASMQGSGSTLLMNGQGGDHVFLSPAPPFSIRDLWESKRLTQFFPVMSELSSLYRTPWWTLLNQEFKNRSLSQSNQSIRAYFTPDWLESFSQESFYLAEKLAKFPYGKGRQIKGIFHGVAYSERDELPFSFSHCHPLLSQPLVEKALQIPTYQSFDKGFDRIYFRRAISRLHKTEALWRRRKSNTNTSSLKAFEMSIQRIRDVLLSGSLAKSGIIDVAKVEKSLAQIRHGQMEEVWPILHLLECQKWLIQWGLVTHEASLGRLECSQY